MKHPSICFLVNEQSNSGRAGTELRNQSGAITERIPTAEFIYISNPDELDAAAAKAADGFDVLVACGGDGTMQSIARAAAAGQKTMAVIPVGSGNDFSKSVHIKTGQTIHYYLDIIENGQIRKIDFPTFNGNPFLNTVGIGFDGLAATYAADFKRIKGKTKYVVAAVKALIKSKRFSAVIELDNQVLENQYQMLTVANGNEEGGGFRISPASANDDGILEMILIPGYNKLKLTCALLLLATGRNLSDRYKQEYSFKDAIIRFDRELYLHMDGELGAPVTQAKFHIGTLQVRVIVPTEHS